MPRDANGATAIRISEEACIKWLKGKAAGRSSHGGEPESLAVDSAVRGLWNHPFQWSRSSLDVCSELDATQKQLIREAWFYLAI